MKPNGLAACIDFTMKNMFDVDLGVALIMNGYHLESARLDTNKTLRKMPIVVSR
jgi:hypothetical protein